MKIILTNGSKIDYELAQFHGNVVLEDRLSPFYSELLELLQRRREQRSSEVDYLDPQLNELIKGLSPSSADETLPLSEIIDNYQFLFGSKGPIHIEKTLMEAFPVQDFIDLGLTRYYPRIYRGLPRLYHRSHPSQSHIKKNFTHLPSLKKQAVSKALFSLYGKIPTQGTVTIFTWVINDGLGDYIAGVEIMRLLKGRLPELELKFVGLVHERSAEKIILPENATIIPYKDDLPFPTPEALEILRTSDLILQIPTYFPHTQELLEALNAIPSEHPMPRMECVGEYGYIESSWFHPKLDRYSMGLHFLEKGILVRKPCQATWDDVQNEKLREWHRSDNHFYLAYLTSPYGGAIYLHALLKSLEEDPKNIDLCVPDLGWFIQFVEKQKKLGRPLLEWDLGIAAIEVYFDEQVYPYKIASTGKTVRLLCPGTITQSDFRALLALSGEWVAVRGDQSFSEAVSQNKTFFYDGREHARYFIKDLVAIAENRISFEHSTLTCIRGMNQAFGYVLPIQDGEWVDETFFQESEEWTSIALSLGLSLQDPNVHTGFKKLNRILSEEFSANPFLVHLVQRALCHRRHPEIERKETEEMFHFVSNLHSFSELIENLRLAITQLHVNL